jgi:ParB family chromosome partitioning protein
VREAEKLVTKIGSSRQQSLMRIKAEKPRDLLRIEQELSDALTAAVEIRVKKRTRRGEQGEVAIHFGSLDELNGLLDKLGLAKA